MNLLAFDAATDACSAALLCGHEIQEEFAIAPRQHNRLLLGMCDAVLKAANTSLDRLDALAFGHGPGAFTGVRVAAAAAQGIAYARGLPLVSISDLAVMAQQLFDENDGETALVTIDARMGEIYYGCFRRGVDGLGEPDGEECVAPPARLMESDRRFDCVGGSGLASYPELAGMGEQRDPDLLPRAGTMLKLAVAKFRSGEVLQAAQAAPVYLRGWRAST